MIGRTNSTFGGSISLPDGSTATANDVQTWLKCAGINKSYTSVSQVVADTDTMFLLMSDENAMKYLARSTDFADTICADETSMTYLGQSAYVDSTILNSNLWKQKIKASQYWTLVYASKTVTVYGGAYETITIDGYYGSFTTNADGSVSHVVPIDTITLTGSVSGQSFTRTVTSETTDVKVMPEGALYWYGNQCTWVSGGWDWSYWYQTGMLGPNYEPMFKTNEMYVNLDWKNSNYNTYTQLHTNNIIDLTGYSLLKGIVSFSLYNNEGSIMYGFNTDSLTERHDLINTDSATVSLQPLQYGKSGGYFSHSKAEQLVKINNYTSAQLITFQHASWKSISQASYYAFWLE